MQLFKPPKLYKTTLKNGKPDWYVLYYFRHPQTGKFKPIKRRGGMNYIQSKAARQREAEIIITSLNDLLKSGWTPFGTQHTPILKVGDQLIKLIELKKRLRRRTWQSYKYAADDFNRFIDSKGLTYITAKDITPQLAQEYFDKHLGKRKLKGKSMNGIRSYLIGLFNMLIDREIITANPFKKVKPFPEEKGQNIPFSELDRDKLIKHLKKHRPEMYLFVQFIYYCYLRPIELLRLRVSNIDIKSRTITIYGDQSKNKKQETIEIPDAFYPDIMDMKLQQYERHYFLFGRGLRSGPVSIHRNQVTKLHNLILKELKFPKGHTLYQHKHSGVIRAYREGIKIHEIMCQLRHHSLDQTQIYLRSLGMMRNDDFRSKMK